MPGFLALQAAGLETDEAPLYHQPLGEVLRAIILYERKKGTLAIRNLRDLMAELDRRRWPYHACAVRLGLGSFFG